MPGNEHALSFAELFVCVLRGEGFEPAQTGHNFELSLGLTTGFLC